MGGLDGAAGHGLNLIPIGQLDGGHILYSLIGERARLLFYPLIGGMVMLVLHGNDAWLFWLILLFLFGRDLRHAARHDHADGHPAESDRRDWA